MPLFKIQLTLPMVQIFHINANSVDEAMSELNLSETTASETHYQLGVLKVEDIITLPSLEDLKKLGERTIDIDTRIGNGEELFNDAEVKLVHYGLVVGKGSDFEGCVWTEEELRKRFKDGELKTALEFREWFNSKLL